MAKAKKSSRCFDSLNLWTVMVLFCKSLVNQLTGIAHLSIQTSPFLSIKLVVLVLQSL